MATASVTARKKRAGSQEIPQNWTFKKSPLGIEMEYRFRERGTRAAVLAIGLGCTGFFGYWLFQMTWAFAQDPSSVEWGGILFLLLFGCGFGFGLYCLARLFARTYYQLGPGVLLVNEYVPGRSKSTEIPRGLVESLTCVYTPNSRTAGEDTYKLIINWRSGEGRTSWIAMEGSTKAEALWLGAILSEWCGKEVVTERSGA